MNRAVGLYVLLSAFIAGWWAVAFLFSSTPPPLSPKTGSSQTFQSDLSPVSPLDREEIRQALAGDASNMLRLIERWHIDAECLCHQGIHQARSLPLHQIEEARLLLQQIDADGPSDATFLPQSHSSAAFLLSLLPAPQIAALPKGFRDYENLYSPEIFREIPLTMDRYHSEAFVQKKPQLAFVATYSHPSTVEALWSQGIRPICLPDIFNVDSLHQAISLLGEATGREKKARLLTLFIDAALLAIDNRFALLDQERDHAPFRVIYLQHFQSLSLPTGKNFVSSLLQRLPSSYVWIGSESWANHCDWGMPVTREFLERASPDCLLISSYDPPERISSQLPSLPCWRKGAVFTLDRSVQDFPSPYLILAYYDLFASLAQAQA